MDRVNWLRTSADEQVLSGRRAVMGCCQFSLLFADLSFLVKNYIVHCQARPTACSPTGALLQCCLPSNLSTTTQGAIVKLHRASPELCILELTFTIGTLKPHLRSP